MKKAWIKYVGFLTGLMGIPIIYEFHLHPIYGFLTAFLLGWLTVEEAFSRSLDRRIIFSLFCMVLIWKGNIPVYLFSAVCAFAIMEIFRLAAAQFRKTGIQIELIDADCKLRENAYSFGLIPMLMLGLFVVLSSDMLWNPWASVLTRASDGGVIAQQLVTAQEKCTVVGASITDSVWLIAILTVILASAVGFFWYRKDQKEKQGYEAFYPIRTSESYVIGILAGMVGFDIFFFVVLLVSLVFGEIAKSILWFMERTKGQCL